jgi:hypothetical protein
VGSHAFKEYLPPVLFKPSFEISQIGVLTYTAFAKVNEKLSQDRYMHRQLFSSVISNLL